MSRRSRPSTKQKRPRRFYRIVYAPIALPAEFPLLVHDFHSQGDAPITYLHGHDCLELGYCHSGAGIFVIGDKVLPFAAGAVSCITPSEFHLARSMAGTESRWAWLYLDPFRLLQMVHADTEYLGFSRLTGRRFRNIFEPGADPKMGFLLRQILEEVRDNRPGWQTSVRGLVLSLMVRLQRLRPKRARAAGAAEKRALHRVAPALDRMAAHYSETVPAAEWARSCHVSATHFRRLFRQALGLSPHQYLTALRVRMAATRLHGTTEKIVAISESVGFTSLSSFNRAFRAVMKSTPRAWRNNR